LNASHEVTMNIPVFEIYQIYLFMPR